MMSFLKSLMLLLCINQSINPVISTEYWISASTGNDGNNGKSITAPYRSINRIYSERLMSGDIVHLCRGDKWSYTMISHTVSGVIWDSYSCRAAYTKKPVVSPAIDLDFAKWRTSTSNPQVLIYDITGDNTALNTGLRALWVGGVRYSLARWPNLVNPDVTYGQVGEFAQMQSIQGRTLRSTDITQPAGYFTGTRVHWRQANWLYFDTYITGSAPGQMTLDKDWGTQPNFWYFAEANMNGKFPNHLQLLDQGGEYVFDVASKSIYLIPLNEQHRAQILSGETTVSTIYGNIGTAASLVQPGSLIGIEFTMSSGGIWSTAANVNILNCTISHTLGQGFAAQGWKNNIKVMYNEILDIEGSCVEFSSVNGEVSYNKINGCGMYGRNAATWNGITIGGGLVSNNEISNCGYACVHPHYAAAVDRNVINNAMMTLNDGGAIYTFGTTDNGAVITNNVVNYVYGNYASYFPTRIATCMYMDEGSYGSRMQNNSCSGSVQQCVFLHRCFSHSVLMNNCQSPGMYLVEGSGHQIAGNLVRTAGTDGQLQNPLFRMMTRLQPNYINMFTAWDQLYCSSAPAGDYIYQRQTVNGTWRYNKFDDWVADERLVNPDFEASSKMFRNCDGFKPVDINSVDPWGFLKSSSSSSSSTGVSSSSSIISSSSSSSPVVSSSSSSQRPIPSYPLGGCMFRGPYNLVAASVNFTATMRDVDINVGARFLQEVAAWGETRGFDNLYLPSANPMSGLYCTPIMEKTFGDEPTYTWIVWLINDRRAVDFAVQFNQMIKTTGFFGQSSGVNALVSPGSVAIQQCPKGVTVRIPASCPGASSSSTGSAVPDNSSKGSEAGITSAGGVAAIIIACVFVSAVLIGGVVYHRYRKTRSGSNGNGGGSSGLFPWSNSSPSFSPQYSPSGSPLAEFSTMDGCAPPSPGLEIGVPMHTFSLDQTSQVEEKKGNSLALPSNQPVTVSPSMSSAPFLGIPISPLGSSSQTYSPSQSCAMYQAMPNSPGSPMVNQQPKAVVDYDRQLAAPLKLPQRFKGRFNPFKAAEKPHKIEVTEPSPSQQPEDM